MLLINYLKANYIFFNAISSSLHVFFYFNCLIIKDNVFSRSSSRQRANNLSNAVARTRTGWEIAPTKRACPWDLNYASCNKYNYL